MKNSTLTTAAINFQTACHEAAAVMARLSAEADARLAASEAKMAARAQKEANK